jgi:hypothetical protein
MCRYWLFRWYFHLICWLYHICHSTFIWYVDCIISVIPLPSDMLTVSYLSFHFHLICWLYHIYHSTLSDRSGMTDMIHSTYQMEVEWQIWYTQHSFHFHLICWMYHICHSTFIWYVDCIISIIPLPSDILSVSYLSFYFYMIFWQWNDRYDTVNISHGSRMTDIIQSTYQMEVEWHMIQSTYQMEVEWQI